MSRSVVLKGSPRCERCQMTLRWCICEGLREVECPLQVNVLMHQFERWRPTSTGHLIKRVIPASGIHLYERGLPLERSEVVHPDKTLWILHPQGDPLPESVPPERLQVLLLDGSWRQAGEMMRVVESWGCCVRMPLSGESRYWLRAQVGEGRYCTVEALLFLLDALGVKETYAQLRVQFELHVYAGLCARGAKAKAAEYLADSPLRAALPELLDSLARHRTRDVTQSIKPEPA